MNRPVTPAMLIALAVVLLAGCGDDGKEMTIALQVTPDTPAVAEGCADFDGTPDRDCPTRTATPDYSIHASCPVTPGETVVIDGTPYVVFARACTPTPTPPALIKRQ